MEEIKQEWESFKKCTCRTFRDKCSDCMPQEEIADWWLKKLNLAVSKERERRDAQIIEFINSGEPAPWNDTGWSVELSDVEKFIKNTK